MIVWGVKKLLNAASDVGSTDRTFPTRDLDKIARAMIQRAIRKERQRPASQLQIEALWPMAMVMVNRSKLFVARASGVEAEIAQAYSFDDWLDAAIGLLRIVLRHLPKDLGENPSWIEVEAWALARHPYRLVQDVAAFMLRENGPASGVMQPWVERVRERASRIKDVEIDLLPDRDAWPATWSDTPDVVMAKMFRSTPFRDMLKVWVPINIPDEALHRHAHGMGSTGSGKTTWNEAVIQAFLGHKGMLVFDTKGGMAERLIRHSGRADRILRIDATSSDMRPIFNIAQPPIGAKPERVASIVQFVLAGLSTGMTPLQFSILEMIAKMVAVIPNASIFDFVKLLEDTDYARQAAERCDQAVKRWFTGQYGSNDMRIARDGVVRKLWTIAGSDILKALLCGERNTLDMKALMDERKLVIVTVDKEKLGDDVGLVCRAFIAAFASGMFARSLPLSRGLPDWVLFADEFRDVVGQTDDSLISAILTQGRERRVCLWATHQQFSGQMSDGLRDTILTNTAIKFYCNINKTDASRLAPLIGADIKDMLNLPIGEGGYGHFVLWISNYVNQASRARVRFGHLQSQPKMPNPAFLRTTAAYRQYWAAINAGVSQAVQGDVITPDNSVINPDVPDRVRIEDARGQHQIMPWLRKGGKKP